MLRSPFFELCCVHVIFNLSLKQAQLGVHRAALTVCHVALFLKMRCLRTKATLKVK